MHTLIHSRWTHLSRARCRRGRRQTGGWRRRPRAPPAARAPLAPAPRPHGRGPRHVAARAAASRRRGRRLHSGMLAQRRALRAGRPSAWLQRSAASALRRRPPARRPRRGAACCTAAGCLLRLPAKKHKIYHVSGRAAAGAERHLVVCCMLQAAVVCCMLQAGRSTDQRVQAGGAGGRQQRQWRCCPKQQIGTAKSGGGCKGRCLPAGKHRPTTVQPCRPPRQPLHCA